MKNKILKDSTSNSYVEVGYRTISSFGTYELYIREDLDTTKTLEYMILMSPMHSR